MNENCLFDPSHVRQIVKVDGGPRILRSLSLSLSFSISRHYAAEFRFRYGKGQNTAWLRDKFAVEEVLLKLNLVLSFSVTINMWAMLFSLYL